METIPSREVLAVMPATGNEGGAGELQASLQQARKRFLASVAEVRPRLHRYCTRMTGSVLDGEDLVQEILAQAFYALPSLQSVDRLEPWLFRIAHNKCVDFLRRFRRPGGDMVLYDDESAADDPLDDEPEGDRVDHALLEIVTRLPPMERSCLLLKDVLDYSLAEIAAVVDSTVGGVKAALHRARGKVKSAPLPQHRSELDSEERRLLQAYVDCFNRRDWENLQRLIQADARLEIVGVAEGAPATTYFSNYAALSWEWRFELGRVDGEPMVVLSRREAGAWRPATAVRLWWRDGRVVRIRDYVHVDYLLASSRTTPLEPETWYGD